jgi:hypothetical protein
MPFAHVIRSGATPYLEEANHSPMRPKPVMTSSATSAIPYLSHSARSPGQ